LHFLCSEHFNERRGSAFKRFLANKPELDRLFLAFVNSRVRPANNTGKFGIRPIEVGRN
jgi:hypothetical protein